MKQKLTRRRFSQLLLLGTAAAIFQDRTTKALAQTRPSLIYGARAVPRSVALQSLNLETGQVEDLNDLTSAIKLLPNERLTGFSSLPDGTFVIATTTARTTATASSNRLMFLDNSSPTLTVSGLAQGSTIESLMVTKQGSLLSLVSQNNHSKAFRLTAIDRQTGKSRPITELSLPRDQRFGTLTQCADGTIYASSPDLKGNTSLVELSLEQGQFTSLPPLNFNGTPWQSGLRTLACSPANQLYVLAAPQHETINSLYTVDTRTGAMSFLRDFAVNQISFSAR
ncbi:MAG TPA: hypothetical protein V6D03_06200 [Candidatus Caenarcaniphilales bacterium]